MGNGTRILQRPSNGMRGVISLRAAGDYCPMRTLIAATALAGLMIAGCSGNLRRSEIPASPTSPANVSVTSPPTPPAQADSIRASRLTVTLTSTTGKRAQVDLYASDEKVRVEDAPSCLANRGDTLRTGTYRFYLQPEDSTTPEQQSVSPYMNELLAFNDQRQYLQVVPGEAGKQPDLLAVMQYGSCNGNAVAFLALSPDGRRLIHYRFKFEDGQLRNTTGTKTIEALSPGVVRTSIYNNAIGKRATVTWEIREAEELMVAIK